MTKITVNSDTSKPSGVIEFDTEDPIVRAFLDSVIEALYVMQDANAQVSLVARKLAKVHLTAAMTALEEMSPLR